MAQIIRIEPDAVLDEDSLGEALGVSDQVLLRARREGRLRFSKQGNRVLYLGHWVLDWLQADASQKGVSRG